MRYILPILLSSTLLVWLLYGTIDRDVIFYIDAHQDEQLKSIFEIITLIGDATWWIVGSAGLWIYYHIKKDRYKMVRARFMFVAIITSGLIVNLLKMLFGKARPDKLLDEQIYGFEWFVDFTQYSMHGFPSGHTTLAFTVATTLSFIAPRYTIYFLSIACMVAVSRVAVLYHYPTDIVAGAALGATVSILLYNLGKISFKKRADEQH